jgi:hypothetical protein
VLDGGQSAEGVFPALSVVGTFDSGDDRDPEFLAGGPPPAVEHVLLQQREEGVHGRIVAGRADPAHRSGQLVAVEGPDELPAAELRPTVGVHDAAFIPRLEQAGAGVESVSRRFYVDACSALDAAVSARAVRHGNQPELNAAVAVARWSSSGDAGQRVLSRKDPKVSGLVAAALALHGLTRQPRMVGGGCRILMHRRLK